MIQINPRQVSIAPDLVARFRAISPATVGHIQDFGFMDPALRPVGRRIKLCGPAVTVRTVALDSAVVHRAIDVAEAGDVIIIDRVGDTRHASWGEMTTRGAMHRGIAGTIIDGAVTDIVEIEDLGFPVFARSISALTTKGLALAGEINTTVQCGGVVVRPGDLVLADDNGIVVIAPEQAEAMLDVCEPRERRESWMREELAKGRPLSELSGSGTRLDERLRTEQTH